MTQIPSRFFLKHFFPLLKQFIPASRDIEGRKKRSIYCTKEVAEVHKNALAYPLPISDDHYHQVGVKLRSAFGSAKQQIETLQSLAAMTFLKNSLLWN